MVDLPGFPLGYMGRAGSVLSALTCYSRQLLERGFPAAQNPAVLCRYEEEGGLEIQGHARKVEGSVRQKNDKRRRQREAKKARLAEEKVR